MPILNISYIAQNVRLFVQWLFVSEMPCNPQAYGVWARQGLQLIPQNILDHEHHKLKKNG
jgi:hypothetical protein